MTCSSLYGSGIFMRVSHLVYIGHEFITAFLLTLWSRFRSRHHETLQNEEKTLDKKQNKHSAK